MEVLTIETKSFKALLEKVDLMVKLLIIKNEKNEREGLLDTEQLCTLLKMSKSTAKRLRDDYKIAYIKSGRKIYYRKADVEKYLNDHRSEADR